MNSQTTKTCARCKQEKSTDDFGKNSREIDSLHYYCKTCVINIKEQNKKEDPEYFKRYAENNRDKLATYQRKYHTQKKQEGLQKSTDKQDIKLSKEEDEETKIKKEEYRKERRNYFRKKYKTDLQFKLKKQFESKLNRPFKDNNDTDTTINLIGCTITQFKAYLEPLFLQTMSWSNYGQLWSFDRIIPFCDFDLSNKEDAKRCFHYTNVQPLFIQTRIIDEIEYVGNANKNRYSL